MLKIKDEKKYLRQNPGSVPVDICLAFNVPATINEVVLHDSYRFRIVKELTREEFLERLRIVAQHEDAVSGTAMVKNSRFDIERAEDVPPLEIPDNVHYFYAAELIR